MTSEGKVGEQVIYPELSYQIVGILYEVYNELGYGYREKHYERAIAQSLARQRLPFKRQLVYRIMFKGECVGRYFLDFLIDDKIILELKCGNYFSRQNMWQVRAYLFVSKKQLAILANFTAEGVRYKRVVNKLTN